MAEALGSPVDKVDSEEIDCILKQTIEMIMNNV